MIDISNITWLAWAAPLVMLWGHARALALRFSAILIRRETFSGFMITETERWLRENGVYISGRKDWAADTVPCSKTTGFHAWIAADARDVVSVYLVGRLKVPVVWDVQKRCLTYMAGTINRRQLSSYFDAYARSHASRCVADSRRDKNDFSFGSGFRVDSFMGLGKNGQGNQGGLNSRGGGEPVVDTAAAGKAPLSTAGSAMEVLYMRWAQSPKAWFDEEQLTYDYRSMMLGMVEEGLGDEESRRNFEKMDPYITWGPMPQLFADFRRWAWARDWFYRHKICWRRGALLYGVPGTGKTEMILALAQRFDCVLVRAELQTMGIRDLERLAEKVRGYDRCILLIEDIDAVFNGRENVLMAKGMVSDPAEILSFEAFINFLGGAVKLPGCYTIVTSNHPDKLDPALTRAGRLDLKLEVKPMNEEEGRRIVGGFLGKYPGETEKALAAISFPATMADVLEECTKRALDLYNQEKA